MARVGLGIALTVALSAWTLPACADMLVADGYAVFESGERVEFGVPVNETLAFTHVASAESYRLVPFVVPGGKSVEFVISLPGDRGDDTASRRVELEPGMSESLDSLGLPFTLGFTRLSLAADRTSEAEDGVACSSCSAPCGSWSVTCTVCTSGWCCSVYCNGSLRCKACL